MRTGVGEAHNMRGRVRHDRDRNNAVNCCSKTGSIVSKGKQTTDRQRKKEGITMPVGRERRLVNRVGAIGVAARGRVQDDNGNKQRCTFGRTYKHRATADSWGARLWQKKNL